MNFRNFQQVDGDIDFTVHEKTIHGRITKMRAKAIIRFARMINNSDFGRCGHDFDCCGCLCGRSCQLQLSHNSATIKVTNHYNY